METSTKKPVQSNIASKKDNTNHVEAKFSAISNNEGTANITFIKMDGSQIIFVQDLMKGKNLGYDFLDENGGANNDLIGKTFIIDWNQEKENNDGTGDVELVNKIVTIKQK